MNVINVKQFQMDVRTNRGRTSVVLKGDLNEKAAWQLLKQLETFQPSRYPIYLDIGGVGTMHWFAANILKSGFEHLLTSRGEIFLIQKRKKPQPISQGDFLSINSSADGKKDEV
ncbi:hypothetical protein [Candidatus Nitronereus thalassa]|uniref:Uncharacterized protein n=1 Tax=Candidatus Nitronereus thalassa TaxID=3020898 RepID=A0ABU3KB24_9BACT|nr:hypothetical protein [Candidatus Nitronereus thalassa]MDT7043685.1 hypothetical protein [Candidatus Nitronereus thalassa]